VTGYNIKEQGLPQKEHAPNTRNIKHLPLNTSRRQKPRKQPRYSRTDQKPDAKTKLNAANNYAVTAATHTTNTRQY
jgi:hypothetical protein